MSIPSYPFHSLPLKLPNKGMSFTFSPLKLPNKRKEEYSKIILFISFHSISFPPPKRDLRDLPDTIYKLQQLQDLSIPTTRLRFTCNSFDSISGYGFLMMEHLDIGHCLNLNKLDFLIQPDYFPALKSTSLPRTNIITIPESISRFPRLGVLSIQNCKQLREILGLPKSIKWVNATDCFKLDLQSLLSQVYLSTY